jgi:hypothetical protein
MLMPLANLKALSGAHIQAPRFTFSETSLPAQPSEHP